MPSGNEKMESITPRPICSSGGICCGLAVLSCTIYMYFPLFLFLFSFCLCVKSVSQPPPLRVKRNWQMLDPRVAGNSSWPNPSPRCPITQLCPCHHGGGTTPALRSAAAEVCNRNILVCNSPVSGSGDLGSSSGPNPDLESCQDLEES